MDIGTQIAISILVALAMLIIVAGVTLILNNKKIEDELQQDQQDFSHFYKYFLEKVPNDQDPGIHYIDQCIQTAADNYTIMMLSQNTYQYLNTEDIERMRRYIIGTVNLNLTSAATSMISWTHDIADNNLDNLIDLRTKIFLVGFVADYNKEIPDEET